MHHCARAFAILTLATVLALPTLAHAQDGPIELGPAQRPLYDAAKDAANKGEHDTAVEILQGMLRLGDLDVVWIELARNHVQLGHCDDAEQAIAKARESTRTTIFTDAELDAAISNTSADLKLNCAGRATAAQLYELGIDYFEKREWLKAAQAFELALESDEDATLAHNAGRSYEYAGQLEKAEALYRRALTLAPDDEVRDKLERNLERMANLRARMGESKETTGLLDISSEPSGAIVRLNGIAIGETPYLAAHEPGVVTLSLTLEGHAEVTREMELEPGREVVFSAVLEPEGRTWTWVALGSSALLAGGGLTFGLLAQRDFDTINAAEGRRANDFNDIRDRGKLFSQLSLSLYVAAAAGVVTSGVLYVVEGASDDPQTQEGPTTSGMRWIIGPDYVGVAGQW